MKFLLRLLLLTTFWLAATQAESTPARAVPLTPSVLFENLAHATKPLWRQQYRDHIERTVTERDKAALALGAVSADLALATMARDSQQIRNLIQDEQALEKMLSIIDKMDNFRQKVLTHVEAENWPDVTHAVDKVHERQLELLIVLRDQDLATLVTVGRWLRTWQITTNIVISKQVSAEQLAIGSLELLGQTAASVETLATPENSSHLLHQLAKRLAHLHKLWQAIAAPDRLPATKALLDELILQLIQDEPNPPRVTPQP